MTCTHAAVKIQAAWRRQNRTRGCRTNIEATPPPGGEVGISITSVERAGEEEIGDGGSARAGIGLTADERAVGSRVPFPPLLLTCFGINGHDLEWSPSPRQAHDDRPSIPRKEGRRLS